MYDEKWKLEYDLGGLKLKFQNYNVKKSVDIPLVIETMKNNAPKIMTYLIQEKWTFYFRYLVPEGDEIENVFFYLEDDIKRINFNVDTLMPIDLMYHYISYAILYAYELHHEMRNSTYVPFLSAMMMEFSDFSEVAKSTADRIVNTFSTFDVVTDDFLSMVLYEYATPIKYLCEAYALYVEGNEELKQLELTTYIIEKMISNH